MASVVPYGVLLSGVILQFTVFGVKNPLHD